MGALRVTRLEDVPDPSDSARDEVRDGEGPRRVWHAPNLHQQPIHDPSRAARGHRDPAPDARRVPGREQKQGLRLKDFGDCSPHLLPFYEHLGYRRYTAAFNDTAYGFKVPILMLLGDRKRFEQVRTPLARIATEYPDDAEARAWFERTYPGYLKAETATLLEEGAFMDLLANRVAPAIPCTAWVSSEASSATRRTASWPRQPS